MTGQKPLLHTQVPWNVSTFLKHGVSNDPETFSYVMKTYERTCAHTKTSQIALQRELFGFSAEQLDLQFQARRCTCRSWAYLKLQCLCARLRLGVVKTHSDVNSWPSRSPSSEHPLLSCLRSHFFENCRKWLYHTHWVVYYESMKRNLKIKPIYECQCNGRLQTKRFTRLSHTGLVVELEHLYLQLSLSSVFICKGNW